MSESVLDPELAERARRLKVLAARAVDGLLSGQHRSPHRGASMVFVEHREYRPGDDLRLLDWRAYARSDRHQVKRFEQQTHLRTALVLDRSSSMSFVGGGPYSKLEYASQLLAALAYLLVRQGDAPALFTIDEQLDSELPFRTRPAHLDAILQELAKEAPEGRGTQLARGLARVADRCRRRGLIVVASDLLDFEDDPLAPLATLIGKGHEVIVLQVMSPQELSLAPDDPARFIDRENGSAVVADPRQLAESYALEVNRFIEAKRQRCLRMGARHVLCATTEAPHHALARALRLRGE